MTEEQVKEEQKRRMEAISKSGVEKGNLGRLLEWRGDKDTTRWTLCNYNNRSIATFNKHHSVMILDAAESLLRLKISLLCAQLGIDKEETDEKS